MKNVGYLAYDDRFLYVGLRVRRPRARAGSARLSATATTSRRSTDYGGVILDTRQRRPHGDPVPRQRPRHPVRRRHRRRRPGEDSSPDFFWDAAGAITDDGWTLEIRIPFSSLRYPKADPQTWGIMLYRNYPRDFRYQFFTTRLPQGTRTASSATRTSCRASRSSPAAGHLVVAPYASARAEPRRRPAGSATPLESGSRSTARPGSTSSGRPAPAPRSTPRSTPTSRRSSPTSRRSRPTSASRSSIPEKRPFFLEGIDLFSTPIQAVYTRTITSPRFGARGTGKWGALTFTGARRRRPRRRPGRDPAGPERLELRRPGLSRRSWRSAASGATSARASSACSLSDREIDERRLVEPRPRPRLPVAPERQGRRDRPAPLERLADSEPARPRRRVGRPTPRRTTRASSAGRAARATLRLLQRRVPRRRRRLPRRQRLRAAGRLPARLPRDRLHVPAEDGAAAPLPHVPDRPTTRPTATATCSSRSCRPGSASTRRWNTFVRIRYAWERLRSAKARPRCRAARLVFTVQSTPSRLLPGSHPRRLRRQRHRLRRRTPGHGRTASR